MHLLNHMSLHLFYTVVDLFVYVYRPRSTCLLIVYCFSSCNQEKHLLLLSGDEYIAAYFLNVGKK